MALTGSDYVAIIPSFLVFCGAVVGAIKVITSIFGKNKRQKNIIESKNNVILFDQLHGLYKQACIDLENLRKECDKKKEELEDEIKKLIGEMHKQDLEARDAKHEKNNMEMQKIAIQDLWDKDKRKLGRAHEQIKDGNKKLIDKELELKNANKKLEEKEAEIIELKRKIETFTFNNPI